MTHPRSARRKISLSVQTTFRHALYAGFLGCLLATIAILGWGGAWWAPMFGTVAFGVPAVIAYLTEQERQQNLETVRMNLQMRGGEGSWDLDDNDDGDPTVPPTKEYRR